MNANPQVMEYFPGMLDRAGSRQFMARINATQQENGFCFWAAELLETGQLMGFIGLNQVSFEADFTPAVEIGWRLAPDFWGKGLASEGAKACLQFAFERLRVSEVVSFTPLQNQRSYHVMERIGMKRSHTFAHPKLEPGSWLEQHLLYRISRTEWEQKVKSQNKDQGSTNRMAP